ncbi:hypothetical protein [Neomegalonema sp.]|uniref:hypothetical protein n=1 Tax=Neomegalonema sp. TaxID=2039713 RepID=UPI00262B9CD0|nr:hypothetical protein [Neomegalonema sp.]MDD2869651.1 hypothetical protein [Neomegalonema sp.]
MRIAKSHWASKNGTLLVYDKIEHFLCGFILFVILWCKWDTIPALLGVIFVGFMWEIKDGFMPWEKYGFWGGEGFCWKDLVSTVAGALLGVLIDAVLK